VTHDTTKSLGQRLCEAFQAVIPNHAGPVTWDDFDGLQQTIYERAAIRFTASLSDADPILAARVEAAETARQSAEARVAELERELDAANTYWPDFALKIRAKLREWGAETDDGCEDHLPDAFVEWVDGMADSEQRATARATAAEARVKELEKALKEIADLCPATHEICLASTMGQIAIAALSSQGAEDGK